MCVGYILCLTCYLSCQTVFCNHVLELLHMVALLCIYCLWIQDGAALALKKHVEEEARDLSGEAFSRFMDQLYDRIYCLLESNDVAENLGALRAIDELIDVTLGESASKVSKFSSYMRNVFEFKRDPEILTLASRVLGHLARAGGAMTADEVEYQVCCIFSQLIELCFDGIKHLKSFVPLGEKCIGLASWGQSRVPSFCSCFDLESKCNNFVLVLSLFELHFLLFLHSPSLTYYAYCQSSGDLVKY